MDKYEQFFLKKKESEKRYKGTLKYKENASKSFKKWFNNNPSKVKAHRKVFIELRAGRLKKLPCEVCGEPKSEAHHEDYAKPLEIIWLCKLHHTNVTYNRG